MFVRCNVCQYDSGDFDNAEDLAAQINEDGGVMAQMLDDKGQSKGWDIHCPHFCGPQYILFD